MTAHTTPVTPGATVGFHVCAAGEDGDGVVPAETPPAACEGLGAGGAVVEGAGVGVGVRVGVDAGVWVRGCAGAAGRLAAAEDLGLDDEAPLGRLTAAATWTAVADEPMSSLTWDATLAGTGALPPKITARATRGEAEHGGRRGVRLLPPPTPRDSWATPTTRVVDAPGRRAWSTTPGRRRRPTP